MTGHKKDEIINKRDENLIVSPRMGFYRIQIVLQHVMDYIRKT